ncbi:glycosyltransferase family 2 protein [Pedobacter nyackensis]|uniref:glycosyltransferase family 2 protein n=1 Tax=Pedobacter nyackensis TaxID=475255 RepID=UPI00292E7452|nr:glycosyltransferase family 2 protein [Pedobacter nyackensis]
MINTDATESSQPILTIIIATYNAAQYIKDCLYSITENIIEPYELIIVDGKSSDDTLEIVKSFTTINATVISEKDKGIYDAMNKGTSLATGKWVLFLGADDRLLPSFRKIFSHLNNSNTIYYGNCINGENQFGGEFSAYKLAKMNLCHQAILYPLTVFKKYSFNLKYPVFADYLLNIQCWGDPLFIKNYLNINLAFYNMDGFSSTAEDMAFKKDKAKFVKKYLGNVTYVRYRIRKFKESRRPGSKFF